MSWLLTRKFNFGQVDWIGLGGMALDWFDFGYDFSRARRCVRDLNGFVFGFRSNLSWFDFGYEVKLAKFCACTWLDPVDTLEFMSADYCEGRSPLTFTVICSNAAALWRAPMSLQRLLVVLTKPLSS